MKSYTDVEQSKKLAEFLPLESADMYYNKGSYKGEQDIHVRHEDDGYAPNYDIPCWSLGALLDVLPKVINNETLFIETSPALWHIGYRNIYTERADNLVDACYELILKLKDKRLI